MIQHLDRFALTHLLSGKKSSWIGLCGTLLLLGVCLAIYVPAILSYFKGNYYQSQYMTYKNHTGYIYSNYAKQNNLSSFEQRAILAAKEARVNIREVFDGKFLAKTFGLEEDNRTARLNDMRESMGSFNLNSIGSFWPSVGEPSVNLE